MRRSNRPRRDSVARVGSRWLALVALAGCLPPLTRDADNAIDLRARMAQPATSTATELYRWAGQRSLAIDSRCRMAPTDSEAFALRAERCGGLAAWYWGVSRLLLEQASSPQFARPIRLDGRLRWIDIPGGCP
jgi:hypothetical protein